MTHVSELIFRQVSHSDFFYINQVPKPGDQGGRQSYIDIPVNDVDLATWHTFFASITPIAKAPGPLWTVDIHSLGGLGTQSVKIGQRRAASVNIREQKIHSRASNRILAWHPDHCGFPEAPLDLSDADDPRIPELLDGVRIFICKTDTSAYWAGWLKTVSIKALSKIDPRFKVMLTRDAGHIAFDPKVAVDVTNLSQPFHASSPYIAKPPKPEEDVAADLFNDDTTSGPAKQTQKTVKTYERNKKAVRELKKLYKTCQITGDSFVFQKPNGDPYLEVHHLIPLGDGGSDDPANLVVISAHMHRMLHYANVAGLDLGNIKNNTLDFTINGAPYTITWRPEHAKVIVSA